MLVAMFQRESVLAGSNSKMSMSGKIRNKRLHNTLCFVILLFHNYFAGFAMNTK